MIEAIIVAVLVATLVGLLLVYLVGPALKMLPGPLGALLGGFFIQWGWLLGVIVGLLFFFGHFSILGFGGGKY